MEAMNPGMSEADVDRFLDWRALGLAAVRDALNHPFDWSIDRPEAEYSLMSEIPGEIRRHWHPVINQLYLYWRAKRDAAGGAPDRSDLDPMLEIPLLCPHICIFEPAATDGDLEDWYCRLMGTHVEQALGLSLTGRRILEFYPNPNLDQVRRYGRVARGLFVSHRSGPSRTKLEERVGRVESLYVPITDRKRGAQAAFGVAVYQWLPA